MPLNRAYTCRRSYQAEKTQVSLFHVSYVALQVMAQERGVETRLSFTFAGRCFVRTPPEQPDWPPLLQSENDTRVENLCATSFRWYRIQSQYLRGDESDIPHKHFLKVAQNQMHYQAGQCKAPKSSSKMSRQSGPLEEATPWPFMPRLQSISLLLHGRQLQEK